jgi:hypothetical protein
MVAVGSVDVGPLGAVVLGPVAGSGTDVGDGVSVGTELTLGPLAVSAGSLSAVFASSPQPPTSASVSAARLQD